MVLFLWYTYDATPTPEALEAYAYATYTFMLLCFRIRGQQRKTEVQRKKYDERQPPAEESQGLDMTGTTKS